MPRTGADTASLTQRLDIWLAPRLRAAERPRAFVLRSELPRDAQGKLVDWVWAAAGSDQRSLALAGQCVSILADQRLLSPWADGRSRC